MKLAEYKNLISSRVNRLNRMTGKTFVTSYVGIYGGWLLYEEKNLCPDCSCDISFSGGRLSSACMLEYLDGVINTLTAIKYGRVSLVK